MTKSPDFGQGQSQPEQNPQQPLDNAALATHRIAFLNGVNLIIDIQKALVPAGRMLSDRQIDAMRQVQAALVNEETKIDIQNPPGEDSTPLVAALTIAYSIATQQQERVLLGFTKRDIPQQRRDIETYITAEGIQKENVRASRFEDFGKPNALPANFSAIILDESQTCEHPETRSSDYDHAIVIRLTSHIPGSQTVAQLAEQLRREPGNLRALIADSDIVGEFLDAHHQYTNASQVVQQHPVLPQAHLGDYYIVPISQLILERFAKPSSLRDPEYANAGYISISAMAAEFGMNLKFARKLVTAIERDFLERDGHHTINDLRMRLTDRNDINITTYYTPYVHGEFRARASAMRIPPPTKAWQTIYDVSKDARIHAELNLVRTIMQDLEIEGTQLTRGTYYGGPKAGYNEYLSPTTIDHIVQRLAEYKSPRDLSTWPTTRDIATRLGVSVLEVNTELAMMRMEGASQVQVTRALRQGPQNYFILHLSPQTDTWLTARLQARQQGEQVLPIEQMKQQALNIHQEVNFSILDAIFFSDAFDRNELLEEISVERREVAGEIIDEMIQNRLLQQSRERLTITSRFREQLNASPDMLIRAISNVVSEGNGIFLNDILISYGQMQFQEAVKADPRLALNMNPPIVNLGGDIVHFTQDTAEFIRQLRLPVRKRVLSVVGEVSLSDAVLMFHYDGTLINVTVKDSNSQILTDLLRTCIDSVRRAYWESGNIQGMPAEREIIEQIFKSSITINQRPRRES